MQLDLGGACSSAAARGRTLTTQSSRLPVWTRAGLGLPDRDYYTKDDAKSKETRERYLQHVQKIFELLGDKPEVAQAKCRYGHAD